MIKNKYVKIKIALILVLSFSAYTNAQSLNVGGQNWSNTISATTISEEGNDYPSDFSILSPTNQITLAGTIPASYLSFFVNRTAKVSVHYNSVNWPSALKLGIRRNNSGNAYVGGFCLFCSASINGGQNFVAVPQQSEGATFFTISSTGIGLANSLNFSNVFVQVQVLGFTVLLPAETYNAEIVFTIGAN